MKVALVVLLIGAAYLTSAVPIEEPSEYSLNKEYPRFIKFPDGEGNLHDVDLEEEPDMELVDEITRNPANNVYLLYTRSNRLLAQTLINGDASSIRNSNFNPNLPIYVVVHGWLSNRYTNPNPTLRNTYLDRSDCNVIVMEWRNLASSSYATAAAGVPAVGRVLGEFLNFLNREFAAPYITMHLAGFSLGAHVVGNAGRATEGKVARVTGLDPAGPLWNYSANRLRASDGVYVEAIHTDGGTGGLGIGSAIADADFFPNGGNSQPGCYTSLCNHNRAWELFDSSLKNSHLIGRRCTTSLQITFNTCTGAQFPLGNDNWNKSGSGMYRLNTGRSYPY